jgi:hypothetical protein
MSSSLTPMNEPPEDFERKAQEAERGFVSELFAFLRQNRKWWLLPAIIVLLLVGLLGVLGGTALAPFIYTLF